MDHLIPFYLSTSTLIFIYLTVIWRNNTILNRFHKTIFAILSICGIITFLITSGYIIKG